MRISQLNRVFGSKMKDIKETDNRKIEFDLKADRNENDNK